MSRIASNTQVTLHLRAEDFVASPEFEPIDLTDTIREINDSIEQSGEERRRRQAADFAYLSNQVVGAENIDFVGYGASPTDLK